MDSADGGRMGANERVRVPSGSFLKAGLLAAVLVVTTVPTPVVATGRGADPGSSAHSQHQNSAPAPYPWYCAGWDASRQRADRLLAGVYQIGRHPIVELGLDPTWRENPFSDNNWVFHHHSLRVVLSLLETFAVTANRDYLVRASFLLRDWYLSNPRRSPPSSFSWNDHSTALRAAVYACAWRYLKHSTWLRDALVLHGTVLASAAFYVDVGNHALNQSLGLLEIGAALGNTSWRTLAAARINRLLPGSVDRQGVTNEQSVGYQAYNYVRYRLAERRLRELGAPISSAFARVPRMPYFMAHATLPNGRYETIGDTDPSWAVPVAGTWAEFAATLGKKGPKPPHTVAVYRAGYLFARSGWGSTRRMADETFLSLRWGPAPYIHGHADHGSITFYGYGSELLVDPGKYTYNPGPWRSFFRGRTAHNIVTVDGAAWRWTASSALSWHARSPTVVDAAVTMTGVAGVTHRRRVTYSPRLGFVLVEDRLASTTHHTYRQLWHLTADANPAVRATSFATQRTGGNVQVRQLIGGSTSRVVKGRLSPIQGWVSLRHHVRRAAPVVEVIRSGRHVRYLTLITAAPDQPAAVITDLRITSSGYSVTVRIGAHADRVIVNGTTATISPLR